MQSKPFSIQAPEQIAKDYAGNKQKIAEAMQMGIVDPTAGTLAGMFIDRMRSAQMQEMAQQPTVAQQVMGGAPAQAPLAQAGGLGATAPAGPPMAPAGPPMAGPPMNAMPPMDAAPPMAEAPMGMAEGGIAALPVSDAMFDEPEEDGYAPGGIVAFRAGGYNDFHRAIIAKESGGRYGIPNAEGSGAMGIGQLMPDTARTLARRLGLAYRPELLAGDDEEARKYQDVLTAAATKEAWEYGKGNPQLAAQYYFAGPNKEGWGPKTQAYGSDIMERLGGEAAPMPREADISTAAGRAISAEDALALGKRLTGDLPREELDRAKKYALEALDPELQKKEAKMDMWEGLAAMGFRLASSNSPNILQAIGEAATATLPELKLSKKERKAAKDDAVRTLMAIEDVDRKTAIAGVEVGMDIYKTGISTDQAERTLAFREKELTNQIVQRGLDRISAEKIAGMRTSNPSQFESMMAIILRGTQEQKDALKEYVKLTKPQGGPLPGDTDNDAGPWKQYQ